MRTKMIMEWWTEREVGKKGERRAEELKGKKE